MRIGRALKLIGLCLSLCALLSGCVRVTFESAENAGEVALPEPPAAEANAPAGDSRARYSLRTLLYYSNADGSLTSALRLLYIYPEDDPLQSVLGALTEKPYSSSGLSAVAPEGARSLGCVLSGGVATVNLSAESLAEGEEAFFLLRAAVVKTLLAQEGVSAVNVLVEGRACELDGCPLGAAAAQESNVPAALAQWRAECQKLAQGGEGASVERLAVLYLPAKETEALLPRVASARLSGQDYAASVIAAWLEAARAEGYDEAYLPVDSLAGATASESVTPEGARVLTLRLPAAAEENRAALARAACALLETLSRFLPDIDGVRAYAGDSLIAGMPIPGGTVEAEDGVFAPARLDQAVGGWIALYLPGEDGRLTRVERAARGPSFTPREALSRLGEESALFPQGTGISDILGIRLEDGVAHVNLSADLYAACQTFSERRESAFVYAVVNTLVENFPIVSRVQFYAAGEYARTLASALSIGGPLMANPGLAR